MKITALEEYGLRCLLWMARKPAHTPISVSEIAEKEGLTSPYVGKLMAALRQAGFVESVRGRSGGYVLARPATEISVDEVLRALGGALFSSDYCNTHPGALAVCAHHGECSIRPIWRMLEDLIGQVLRGTSLADLCAQEGPLTTRFQDALPASFRAVAATRDAALPMLPSAALPGRTGSSRS